LLSPDRRGFTARWISNVATDVNVIAQKTTAKQMSGDRTSQRPLKAAVTMTPGHSLSTVRALLILLM
jgi:hypothetical protein